VHQVNTKEPEYPCLVQHYAQELSCGNSEDPSLLMNGLRKCGVFTHWGFSQSQRMKFFHSQVNGCNWRTSSQVKLVRFRRQKVAWFPSYADYRPKTNAAILWDTDHTDGRPHM
jgi:hypothetical protein